MHLVEQASYHILVVIIPYIIYHLFIREEEQNRSKLFSKLLGVSFVSIILTMSNPIEYSEGYLYDFRVIPIIFVFLFGGIRPGLILMISMILFRYTLGGDGFLVNLVNYSIATFLLILLKNKFNTYTLNKKVFMISLLYWGITLTRIISLIINGHFHAISFILTFCFLTWSTLLLLIFLINSLDQQIIYYNQMQQSERINVVSQLAASVAHEVRNPMTSIKGFLQLIKRESNLNDNQRKYIEISLAELERTEAVIHDYLSLANPSKKSVMNELDVTNELHSVIDIITSYTNTHSIVIKSNVEEDLYVKGKENEFKQAILNIMRNSVEAIDTNGTLEILGYKKEDKVLIEIKDDGVGMSTKQLAKLGAPYYSTKDKGTGVGLTITYKIIKDLKGKITVHSKPDIGTRFIIELPSIK
nr:sensor histidine kinase [Bacillus pinisoli]